MRERPGGRRVHAENMPDMLPSFRFCRIRGCELGSVSGLVPGRH